MELFPAQPDLSLQISPPNTKQTSGFRRKEDEMDLDFWKITLDSRNSISSMAKQDTCFDLSLSNPRVSGPISNHFHLPQNGKTSLIHPFQQNQYPNHQHQLFQQQQHQGRSSELGFLRPIRGIPVYQNLTTSPFAQKPLDTSVSYTSTYSTTTNSQSSYQSQQGQNRSRFLSRFPARRTMRAPRMRWTTTLHARFLHAVELLGGHERATPKSVLELMDVKDLTLAHVKSHLQMYRTVKTTDRTAASSGQSDLFENGSSGDTSEDLIFDIQNQKRSELSIQQGVHQDNDYNALWSNASSREALSNGKPRNCGGNIPSLEKDMEPQCVSYDRISEVSSSSFSETRLKKPNLEFTLGRSQ